MASQGVLFVTMQPAPGLSLEQFHEWYNNEHGPTRLRLPSIFRNGLRYAANDDQQPIFLAVYDVADMSLLQTPTYTDLRANRSPREADTIGQVAVDRRFYDLALERQAPLFMPIEKLTDDEAAGIELIAVHATLKDVPGAEGEFLRWYEEEHIDLLSKVPGWLRSRWFRTSQVEGAAETAYLVLHEYTKDNGLGGPEYITATTTKWRDEIFDGYVATISKRNYSLFYVFSPAPRELSALSRLPVSAAFEAADGSLRTVPGPEGYISSRVTTGDGLVIPYRLEGSGVEGAPTVAFINSLLTSLDMWSPLVQLLKRQRPDLRILRYDARGRHAIPHPPAPATPDLLANDLAALLDALRVPRLAALVGVSMGGVTALAFALRYPDRVGRLVACDFNAASGAANTQAWKDRIAVAETGGGEGLRTTLAGQTVARWFHPRTIAERGETVRWMTEMVGANDVEGFRYGCRALWDYDLKAEMGACPVPTTFVVGEGDGKGALVKAMEGFRGLMGAHGAELKVVPSTGHLPMSEDPEAFWEAIRGVV